MSSPQLHLAVVLSLATGARQSEIWGLRWQEIDLKDGFLKFEHTKNGDIRVVPVIGEVLDLLRGYHSHIASLEEMNSSLVGQREVSRPTHNGNQR